MELERKPINRYKFDKVITKLKNIFGEVKTGEEDLYNFEACGLELHLLQAYVNGRINDRLAVEALKAVLVKADGYLNKVRYEYEELIDKKSIDMADEIAALFIPFENPELMNLLEGRFNMEDPEDLKKIFEKPVKSIIRIARAIEYRDKRNGIDAYFKFIDEEMHHLLKEIGKFPHIIEAVKDTAEVQQ